MSKGSILIVEDEPLIADDLAATLESQGYHISAILDEAIDVFKHLESNKPNLALLDVKIVGDVDNRTNDPEKLFLRNGQEIVSVMSSDIVYVEAFDNYANVYTETGKFMISHTLKSVEKTLIPLGFHRIHRSYLINFDHIDSISENYVFLKGLKVQIGKSYRKELMDRLTMI